MQSPASSLNCPAILILEFRLRDCESLIALSWWGKGACDLLIA